MPPDPHVVSNKLLDIICTLFPVSYWELFEDDERQLCTLGDKQVDPLRRKPQSKKRAVYRQE